MSEIIRFIGEGKSFSIIALSIFLISVFNLEAIFNFFDNFPVRKLPILKNFMGETGATGTTKEVLQEAVNSALFRYATGINAEKKLREEIIKLHQLADGRLTFSHFKRTLPYLEIKQNGKLGIRNLKLPDKINHYFNFIVSFLAAFITIVLFLIPLFITTEFRLQIIIFSCGILSSALFILTLSQTIPIFLLKRIKVEINRNYKQYFEHESISQQNKSAPSSSWLDNAGMFKDDPLFDEFVEDIKAYRQQLDAEIAAHELDSEKNHLA